MPRELLLKSTRGLSHLEKFRSQVRRFARSWRFSPGQVDEIELALDEALTNVMVHAYRPGEVPRLELHASGSDEGVVFVVRDFGRAYKALPVTSEQVRRQVAGHRRHGLGRFLMQQCMSSVEYRSLPGRCNETILIKHRG